MAKHYPNSIRAFRFMKAPPWTQADLAERVGCRPGEIGRLERGENLPTASLMIRIAAALGRPVEEVFWGLRDVCLAQLAENPLPQLADREPCPLGSVRAPVPQASNSLCFTRETATSTRSPVAAGVAQERSSSHP